VDRMINITRHIGIIVYTFYLIYVFFWNHSNHTSYEPLYLLAIPALFFVLAVITQKEKTRQLLLVISILMIAISISIEVTNGMVNYLRWAQSGMPDKWSW